MLAAALALAAADPVPPTRPRDASVHAACQVVQDYYAAVSRRDYRTAYRLWHGGQSYAHFRKGYARTRSARVTFLKPGQPEGAAGSIFVELPVRVDAVLRSGAVQHFVGSYTLRRVNDVPGSTAAQRRWHIESAHLKQLPAGR
jgi:hypothetical protein